MKRNIFLTIFCLALNSFSFGQLQIFKPGDNNIQNDSTVVVYGSVTTSPIESFLYVYNAGIASINVYARRDSVLLPCKDTDNCFCWAGFCYGNGTGVSPYDQTIGKQDTANGANAFQGHYFPDGHVGIAKIRYVFYSSTNPNDSVWVIVEYDVLAAGVQNIAGNNINFSTPYPNPASSFVNVSYKLTNGVQSANLKIFNLLGECVQTIPLSSSKNKTTIDVQSMSSGVYVCSIEADGSKPAYQKLIVSH